MNPIQPKKLLLTKWTAAEPVAKNKHFLVSKIIAPEPSDSPDKAIEWIELEAVFLALELLWWDRGQTGNDGWFEKILLEIVGIVL